jgi:hypothetical protein
MPLDLTLLDPDNPNNVPDQRTPEPGSQLSRHPYVRRILRENAALKEANQRLQNLQQELFRREVLMARHLEPLNPAPVGSIEPANGVATVVHVDSFRLLTNRVRGEEAPTIRILVGGLTAAPLHAHWIRLGACELRERPVALPGRRGALAVLETYAPIEVLK